MNNTRKTYYHWVITKKGKFYLGEDFYLGYECLYGENRKYLASKFYGKDIFDKKYWLSKEEIIDEGVEDCEPCVS